MEKRRNSYEIKWDSIRGVLGRYPLLFQFSDQTLCPGDEHGFRLINDVSPLHLLSEHNFSELIYVCLGGSTTFGWFVDQKSTYPSQLDCLVNNRVFNFGMPGLDMKNSLEIMIQVFAKRTENIVFLVLFGINEKTGFLQMYDSQLQDFKVTHSLFTRIQSSLEKKLFNFQKKRFKNLNSISKQRYNTFLNGQIAETMTYISLISKLSNALGIKTYFLLQPHGLRYLQDRNSKLRERYLNDLYFGLRENKDIIDISEQCNLQEEDFVDWQHPNEKGYKKIAKTIFDIL